MTAGSTAGIEWLIQIQHLLKLNSQGNRKASENKLIQIQHLLKLNRGYMGQCWF